jgi:hypothetical protein
MKKKIYILRIRIKINLLFRSCALGIRTIFINIVVQGTLREEHRQRVFENSVLRMFGPKREEDGSWRKLHNNEYYCLYSSSNIVRVIISRRMRWAGHVARIGGGERCLQGFCWGA